MSDETSDLSEIRNTQIMNVKTEIAQHLVNYATECVPVATYMAYLLAKITFAGKSIVVSCDILQTCSLENHILVFQCALRVYAKFKPNLRPSKLRLRASTEASSILK